jgi:hypothetical protein
MAKATSTGRVLRDVSAANAAAKQDDSAFDGHTFRSDFKPTGLVELSRTRPSEVLVAYHSEWKGKQSFHIRTIYLDGNDEWCPGKGISVPADQAATIIGKLVETIN